MTDGIRVVVVAYRSEESLPALLGSLPRATTKAVELIVVNNGPTRLAALSPPSSRVTVDVVESGGNPGFGAASNLGVARSTTTTTWIALVNPDVVLGDGALDRLIERGDADPAIAMAGPRILTPSGETYPSARRLPSLHHGIGHALFGTVWRSNPWTRGYVADRANVSVERDAGWLSGSCFLIRSDVFAKVGGFDESYFMYFEDVDLAARVGKAGHRIRYIPSSEVLHIGGASTRHNSRAMIRAHHRSAYLYLSRRYSAWYLAPLRLALRVGLGLRSRLVRA